jgi:predicted ATPase/tetratricopeptide (TPR) repeat protein
MEPPEGSSPRAVDRARRLRAIIEKSDVSGEKHESVAQELGLSLRQFYRERSEACARFGEALEHELALSDATGRRQGAAIATTGAHNLPWQPTSFVGRQRELSELSDLLQQRRIVTITGSGGIGKTRIALEVATGRPTPPDGTWFVDLAPGADTAFVLSRLASLLGIRLPDQGDRLVALIDAIKNRDALLIFDNCEHVLAAVRSVAEAILQGCPRIALLATSRERLGIAGELPYQLSALAIPVALELFVERATTAKYGLHFSDEHRDVAADICRRLDGIALAIELAAARLPVLGLIELQSQLAQQFQVIAGGRHDLPERQRTLHAMISWSHDLLVESERVLFRRLAIFAGGWTLEAAVAVCADDALEASDVLDALFSLTEKSLVVVDLEAPTPRYQFFESTRAFAAEKLERANEHAALSRRHASWMAGFADRAYDLFETISRHRWEVAMAPELDNAFAALAWAVTPNGEIVLAGRIASGLHGFWQTTGFAVTGHQYVRLALERIDSSEHPALAARLLLAQARFGHGRATVDATKRAIALLADTDDHRTMAMSYGMLATALLQTEQYPAAEEACDHALRLLSTCGLQQSLLYAGQLRCRSGIYHAQARAAEAKSALSEALALAVTAEDDWAISLCHATLAGIEFAAGDVHRAVALAEQGIASARKVRGERGAYQLTTLCNLACYKLVLGDADGAESSAREALNLARVTNAGLAIFIAIQHLGAVAALRNQPHRAARLLGYVNALFDRFGVPRDPIDQRGYDILSTSLQRQLPGNEIAAFAAQGAAFAEHEAIEEALGVP